jgi:hypothetical protein
MLECTGQDHVAHQISEYQNTDAQDDRIVDKTGQNPFILAILF